MTKKRAPALIGFLLLALATGSAAHGAQPAPGIALDALFPKAVFAPSIPTQESLLGVRPAARPLRHEELLRYLEALDAASPRARLLEYARSYEGRPLVVLAVSDEATIARLDAFRDEHAALVVPRAGASADPKAFESAKAVAWMAYGIHGDELSSTDAAAALAYWLVAGEDERARALRRDLVVLIDPCENPDGRQRFLALTTSFAHAVPSPDTEDMSHTTIWPWGRGNHYLFDLNRDWFTMVQPESARSSVIASWNPQLMVDSHEMGPDDTYLFSPPRHPFNPFLPSSAQRWWEAFSADQAKALDARGYAYYSREWNEEFFPGYGSSWAAYLGAVGILYEMSGTDGTLVRQRPGTLRTFAQAVEHQLTSSVANLETLAANRAALLADSWAARRDAIRRGEEGPVRAYVLAPGRDPERAALLARVLRKQGIAVRRLAGAVKAPGLVDARTGRSASVDLPAGSYLVPIDQPAGALARVLLDPHVPMEPAFLREEREYLERERGSRLYDTTAWSLAFSFGLPAYWSGSLPPGEWKDEEPPAPQGKLEAGTQLYGYVFDGSADRAAFALAALLENGIAARVAERPFRAAGASFGSGAVLIKREGNPDDLPARLDELSRRFGIEIRALPTAKAQEGPDLGGEHFHPLVAPRVGIFTGMAVSPSAYGALWHTLDREVGMRFTALDLVRFGDADLSRYNVLVLPPTFGGASVYRVLLGEHGLERLQRWIEAGGTAIGIGSGAEFLADKDSKLTRTRLRRQALDRYPPVVLGIGPDAAEAGGPFRAAGLRVPEEEKKPGEKEKKEGFSADQAREQARTAAATASPYDVAPVLGPGALPFATKAASVPETPRSLAAWLKPFLPPGKDKPEAEDLERADERLRRFQPRGVFLRADLDGNLWMAWGLPAELDVWLDAQDTLVAEPPVQVVARFPEIERLHLGGLLWPEAAGRLARTAYCTREALGRGQVVLFLEEPTFRGWTLGTRRLFLNAILYGPGIGTRWSTPW